MGFLESLELNTSGTYTENGQYAKTTTANYLLDLYGTIGALRDAEDDRKTKLFDRAMSIDKLLTAKILFHSRDIREGIGERQTFRTLLRYAADRYPEIVIPNLPLVGFYGRFDDLYCLIGTKCEAEMWETMGPVPTTPAVLP